MPAPHGNKNAVKVGTRLRTDLNKEISELIRSKARSLVGHEPTDQECLEQVRRVLVEWALDMPPEKPQEVIII